LIGLTATFAQTPEDPAMVMPDTQQAAPLLSPDQLNNLVAPIALYPDPLLSQVLSASTYPLEIMEAQQWLGQNRNLQGTQLAEAARQQNWDPSVQALVVFPNALGLLANDVRWTTDLGNAFLAQQGDVMSAVQRMRTRARANGKLNNTPQQVVTTATQDGRDAIEIQPADPQVIYVPVYRPSYVWGPPVWGEYPDMWYPAGFGFGFGFGPGYYMSSYYPGWGGWGGWGWGCGWFGGGLYVNAGFFNHYGYRGGYGGYGHYGSGFAGRSAWTHDPTHRMGVAYSNRAVSSRFSGASMNRGSFAGSARTSGGQLNGSARQGASQINRAGGGAANGGVRSPASGGWQRFGDSNRPQAAGPANGGSRSYQSPAQGYRGSPSNGQSSSPNNYSAPRGGGASASRSYAAPSQSYSAPRSYSGQRSFGGGATSAPRSYSAPSQSYSAPRSSSAPRASGGGSGYSGGHSGGNPGSSGGHSSGGGGHHR
jgi:hypothetical protein